MSDEEFEELAKKRGYAKSKSEEETKAENDNKAQMEKLLAKPKEIDEEVWNEIKAGTFAGFSMEVVMGVDIPVEDEDEQLYSEVSSLLEQIKDIIEKNK